MAWLVALRLLVGRPRVVLRGVELRVVAKGCDAPTGSSPGLSHRVFPGWLWLPRRVCRPGLWHPVRVLLPGVFLPRLLWLVRGVWRQLLARGVEPTRCCGPPCVGLLSSSRMRVCVRVLLVLTRGYTRAPGVLVTRGLCFPELVGGARLFLVHVVVV